MSPAGHKSVLGVGQGGPGGHSRLHSSGGLVAAAAAAHPAPVTEAAVGLRCAHLPSGKPERGAGACP